MTRSGRPSLINKADTIRSTSLRELEAGLLALVMTLPTM
jgi:hypothetical protein